MMSTDNKQSPFITISDAAQFLNRDNETIKRWADKNLFKTKRPGGEGSHRMIVRASFEEYCRSLGVEFSGTDDDPTPPRKESETVGGKE